MSAQMLSNIWRRLMLTVGRGRITLVNNDSAGVQNVQVQLSADELVGGVPRMAEYGFQSSPPIGSDAVLVYVGGDRSNGVVIACGNQTLRMKGLATGEVAISDDKGQYVYLSDAGIVVYGSDRPITVKSLTSVTIDTPQTNTTGNLAVNGNVVATGDISDAGGGAGTKSMAEMRAVFNEHQHGVSAGPTPLMD